ncbi:hypothetical protein HO133_004485 [Letharia lupina]|uniref:Uncharacterized protein n=1 Tax=Letharia lupina TaxID=560253 RepID=A0A8H6KZQ0_9LECA|nr:uncharacterized protein HO133_004485 [Letharia lupina]KAF6230146.1 hypothetical protein HO133_004485 [Letharia lupina]
MFIPHHSFSSTTLILTLLQYLHPASSQTNLPSSPTTTSSLPTTSTPVDSPYYNFTYPTFPDDYDSGIQVSYKDTIDVSWIANGVQNTPVLQIQCWTRNDSNYQSRPSYTHNITSSPSPEYPLPLARYRQYSPCELRLLDPHQTSFTNGSESATSVAFFISEDTNASTAGVTWSEDNAAPKVAVDAGVATAASGSAGVYHKGVMALMWAFVGALAAATVLL